MGGVVNAAAYTGGHKVRDISVSEIADVLRQPDQFVWIGVQEPDEALLQSLQQAFGLHDLAVEDALRAHQRPKLEEYGDSLFVVLRTAQLAGDGDGSGRVAFGETHIFVGPRYVLSVRHGPSVSYTEVRARCESTPSLLRKGPGFVLYAIMDFVVDHYFPIIDALEDELDGLEEAIFGGTFSQVISARIYDLKRDLVGLKRAVSPLVEVCNRLVRYDVTLIPEDARLYFRDVYDHVIRINETIDNQRELLTTALEANLSLISVRQNEVMKQLGAWGAIIAVPTLIAGIYGMNFEFMPETHWRWAYPVVGGLMVGTCIALHVRFQRAGWL